MPAIPGPSALWLVRHGESTANVAASRADRDGAEAIQVDHRDPDVPLSDTGDAQARALGRWFASRADVPTAVWSSTYLRARSTAAVALAEAGIAAEIRPDERLRELLVARPDLATPAPQDSGQLASRAATRASVLRAVDQLDRCTLTTLEALGVALGEVVTLSGPLGSVDLPVGVADLADGTVWAPASAPGLSVRHLVGPPGSPVSITTIVGGAL